MINWIDLNFTVLILSASAFVVFEGFILLCIVSRYQRLSMPEKLPRILRKKTYYEILISAAALLVGALLRQSKLFIAAGVVLSICLILLVAMMVAHKKR